MQASHAAWRRAQLDMQADDALATEARIILFFQVAIRPDLLLLSQCRIVLDECRRDVFVAQAGQPMFGGF